MEPIQFSEATKTLTEPVEWDSTARGSCGGLPVFNDGEESISCWKATWRERIKILLTGRLWLRVVSGSSQPPVAVQVDSPWVTGRELREWEADLPTEAKS